MPEGFAKIAHDRTLVALGERAGVDTGCTFYIEDYCEGYQRLIKEAAYLPDPDAYTLPLAIAATHLREDDRCIAIGKQWICSDTREAGNAGE